MGRMREHDLIIGTLWGILSSPKCADRLWGPTILLFNGYHRLLLKE
jgi:hypothetical protein